MQTFQHFDVSHLPEGRLSDVLPADIRKEAPYIELFKQMWESGMSTDRRMDRYRDS